jgi:hypothetical protein
VAGAVRPEPRALARVGANTQTYTVTAQQAHQALAQIRNSQAMPPQFSFAGWDCGQFASGVLHAAGLSPIQQVVPLNTQLTRRMPLIEDSRMATPRVVQRVAATRQSERVRSEVKPISKNLINGYYLFQAPSVNPKGLSANNDDGQNCMVKLKINDKDFEGATGNNAGHAEMHALHSFVIKNGLENAVNILRIT